MKKGGKVASFLVLMLLIVGVTGYSFVGKMNALKSTQTNMQYIYDHMNSAGEIIDYQGEIRMKNPEEDIKVFVKDNKVTIRFGIIEMHWTAKQFMDPVNLENLARIKITVKVDEETNRLTVYYKGQELQRWVS